MRPAIAWLAVLLVLSMAPTGQGWAGEIPAAERVSGYAQMSAETRAMQDDDAANPGMLWVLEGEALWQRKEGKAARACADCHGPARESMKGVATRYPAFDAETARPLNLEQRINRCRSRLQEAPPLIRESRELLALTAFLAFQSRGQPIRIVADERTRPFIEAGRALFTRRLGQLNIACHQCHDEHWGKRLAGTVIPQAQPTGYPLYRLEWQSLGSLQRRLRGCMTSLRAEPFDYDAAELVNLELFMMWRANGLRFEAPAVRP